MIAVAEDGLETLTKVLQLAPDIAIIDVEMPLLSAFEVIKKARDAGSSTRFIILSYHKEKGFLLKVRKEQIGGYLLKEDQFAEIKTGINAVLRGEQYISKSILSAFHKDIESDLTKVSYLTPSERTILRLVAQDMTSKEIGEMLNISYRTVQKHRSNIIEKLDLDKTNSDLTGWVKSYRELLTSI